MSINDSLMEVYVYENLQLLDQLDELLLAVEREGRFSPAHIDAIFRILHTIKGSSAMMGYDALTGLSHVMEDLFDHLRARGAPSAGQRRICDLAFACGDFLRGEIQALQDGILPRRSAAALIEEIRAYAASLKDETPAAPDGETTAPTPHESAGVEGRIVVAKVFFEKGCKMENVRAFGIIKSLEGLYHKIATVPEDVLSDDSEDEIVNDGFTLYLDTSERMETIEAKIREAFFVQSLHIEQTGGGGATADTFDPRPQAQGGSDRALPEAGGDGALAGKQNFMSVRLDKLDSLMDLVGEIVITESTVIRNPEIARLNLPSFEKAARQLRKLTDELQDIVMSIRMIPISATFHRLERIVRDMGHKVGKEIRLEMSGEDTEIDKNVIDILADPLMHIVRNCVDHGIEPAHDRERRGKPAQGLITLDARNTGGDVVIAIGDDGLGLDRDAILNKAGERGLLTKPPEQMTDKEAYALIFAPGFSTRESVTEYSGRGVGMDVAIKNVEKVGGSVALDSVRGEGTAVQIRVPLTLAIIPGMQVRVGASSYIVPILNIVQSFKPKAGDAFADPGSNEIILLRGKACPVFRLERLFGVKGDAARLEDGILMVIEADHLTYRHRRRDLAHGQHPHQGRFRMRKSARGGGA